ncbi:lipoprotein [Caballeronia choica]|uniref:Lipoprotein n=1 Tax=Caballeronia choica TaxID=326476 RepID=A0A158KFJ6_9BURK|nr:PqiC family protein [Caballeronia choica]SAL79918.1 lipoprotein [Caballeronia choica]
MKFASGFGALLTMAGALSLLAGCASSPSSRFYTLGGDAPAASTMPASFYIEVPPVDMPPQVAKSQLVVQTSAAQVQVLEQERWSSLPADEVRRALSSDLTQQLGAIDVYNTPRPDSVPVYRVKVNMQRFESWPGAQAVIDAVWSVRAAGSQAVLTCRTVVRQPVGDGYDALVAGHRKAVDQLANEISAGVREVSTVPAMAATDEPASSANATAKNARVRAPAASSRALPCPVAKASAG